MKKQVLAVVAAIVLLCLFLFSYNVIFQDYREQKRSELVEKIDAKGEIRSYEVKYKAAYATTDATGKAVIRTSTAYDPISYASLEEAQSSTSDTTVLSLLANIEREAKEKRDQLPSLWQESVTVEKEVS